jgi:predicted DNA-binding transcriptional regulator AlpA
LKTPDVACENFEQARVTDLTLRLSGRRVLSRAQTEVDMRSFSIDDWCKLHGLSRAFFYKLASQGRAPDTFKVGRCTRITDDANLAWIAARKADSQAVAA